METSTLDEALQQLEAVEKVVNARAEAEQKFAEADIQCKAFRTTIRQLRDGLHTHWHERKLPRSTSSESMLCRQLMDRVAMLCKILKCEGYGSLTETFEWNQVRL